MDKRDILSKLYAKISNEYISKQEAKDKWGILPKEYTRILSQTPGMFSCARLEFLQSALEVIK